MPGASPSSAARGNQEFAMVLSDRAYNARLLASLLVELKLPSLEQPAKKETLALMRELRPDIIFLAVDGSRPGSSRLVSEIRQELDVNVVALVEPGDVGQDVALLNAGVDACIHDSDRVDAALAAVRAALRRRQPASVAASSTGRAEVGALAIDYARCLAVVRGHPVHLSVTEFHVLDQLVQNPDVVLQAREIIERATGRPYSAPEARDALKVYIRRLRRKLEDAGIPASALVNVRGFGYMLQSRDCEPAQKVEDAPAPRWTHERRQRAREGARSI